MMYAVIPLMDAVAVFLKHERMDVVTYADALFGDAKRAALAVGQNIHVARFEDHGALPRLKGVSECEGLAGKIRQWMAAEIPLPYPLPNPAHTKDGKDAWKQGAGFTSAKMFEVNLDNPRVPGWLLFLVAMVWHERTKRNLGKLSPSVVMGIAESLPSLHKPDYAFRDGEIEILKGNRVIASMGEKDLLEYSDEAQVSDRAELTPETVREIAFQNASSAMASPMVPLVVHELVTHSHRNWITNTGETGRLLYDDGFEGMARQMGLSCRETTYKAILEALQILSRIKLRLHYETVRTLTQSLVNYTHMSWKRGYRDKLEIQLPPPLRPGFAAMLKSEGEARGQWLVPLQTLKIDHERWRKTFGNRGIAGARRFNFALGTLFLHTKGKLARDGSRVIDDDELCALADKCGFSGMYKKQGRLESAKQLLVTPTSDGDGQRVMTGLGLPTAPLERVDGLPVTAKNGRYRLADAAARKQVLANQKASMAARQRRRRRKDS